ncbi:hypothetical protein RHMOL_Rhmol10G0249700 [Rhododendron molle]|uniref:Uncharacterized protein n=1 Tax=Rhododendron molle TaxID=49168 RepID=A0ACC0M709_RHOML|nr:hypothetical protein RHMOL_Rhmol10G0249700 [Rhododendron molle]
MITVAAPSLAEGGFVNASPDPVVGKSGGVWTVLPLQIPLLFSNLFLFSENQTNERERERDLPATKLS